MLGMVIRTGIAIVTIIDVGNDCCSRGRWMTVEMVIAVGQWD